MAQNNKNEDKYNGPHPITERQEKFVSAYKLESCNVSAACRKTKIPRRTVNNWLQKKDSEFVAQIMDAAEQEIDETEGVLKKLIKGYEVVLTTEKLTKDGKIVQLKKTIYIQPNIRAIEIFLNAKARHRNYGVKPDDSDK